MGYLSTGVLSKLENDRMEPNINHLIRLGVALRVPEEVITNVTGIPETEEEKLQTKITKGEAQFKKQIENETNDKDDSTLVEEIIEVKKDEDVHLEANEIKLEEKTGIAFEENNEVPDETIIIKSNIKEEVNVIAENNTLEMTKQYPFYNNFGTIILSIILICLPLLMIKVSEKQNGLYILIGSSVILIVLLISLLINKDKKKQINYEAPMPITYSSRISKKGLVILKVVLVLLSLGFVVLEYYYFKEIKMHLTKDLLKYAMYVVLGLSALIKIITSLVIKTKTPTTKVTSLTTFLVLAFILDIVATIGFSYYLNSKNILNSQNGLIFLVSMNLVSYIITLISNKISSLFRCITTK